MAKLYRGTQRPKELAKLFKTIQTKTYKQIDLLAGTNTPQETDNLLISTYFPGSTDAYDTSQHKNDPPVTYTIDDNNNFITVEKVRWSINSFDAHKAAGLDGIKIAALREIGPITLQRLTTLYRASIQLAYVPRCL